MATLTDSRKDLTTRLQATRAELQRLHDTDAVTVDGETVRIKEGFGKDLATKTAESRELREALEALDFGKALGEFLDGPDGASFAGREASNGQHEEGLGGKTLGGAYIASEEFLSRKEGSSSVPPRWDSFMGKDISEAGGKDLSSFSLTNTALAPFVTRQDAGFTAPAERTVWIVNLLNPQRTAAGVIEYIRETGFTNNAAAVPERTAADGTAATGLPTDVFGLKPSSDLKYTLEIEKVATIAHHIRAPKTLLDDAPRLAATINGRMIYGAMLARDAQLLYGLGTNGQLTGMMRVTGVQTLNQLTTAAPSGRLLTTRADTIRKAATLCRLAEYPATGAVLNPIGWEGIELEKDDQGRYTITTNIIDGNATPRIWRLPVADSPAMNTNEYLVGAFGLADQYWDRQEASVVVSTEDRDNVIRNAVTILVELRGANEISRPEALVRGAFAA